MAKITATNKKKKTKIKMKKILIVEDEKPMAKVLELKLSNSGFAAKAVFNGQEALTELSKEKYDLIILDLVMPIMDGFSFLKELNAKSIKIPVIVATNLSQAEDANKAKKLGAKDYFVKSDTPIAEVVNHVTKILS